jgi:hypothetical protein
MAYWRPVSSKEYYTAAYVAAIHRMWILCACVARFGLVLLLVFDYFLSSGNSGHEIKTAIRYI